MYPTTNIIDRVGSNFIPFFCGRKPNIWENCYDDGSFGVCTCEFVNTFDDFGLK